MAKRATTTTMASGNTCQKLLTAFGLKLAFALALGPLGFSEGPGWLEATVLALLKKLGSSF